MKPTLEMSPELLQNEDLFSHSFFSDFEQTEGPYAISLPGGIERGYKFPTFYGDVTTAIAIFLCDYQKAKDLLPDPAMSPIRMPRGRAVVTISNYIYRNVSGIPGYNEVALTIPVLLDGQKAPAVLPLVSDKYKKGYYVFGMPVTSHENELRGHKFWGLPKTLNQIDIEEGQDGCSSNVFDQEGKKVFSLTVPVRGSRKSVRETGTICSMFEGKLVRSTTTFAGEFFFNTRARALIAKSPTVHNSGKQAEGAIELGDSPQADVLRKLDMESKPFQTRFCKSMNACFTLPHS